MYSFRSAGRVIGKFGWVCGLALVFAISASAQKEAKPMAEGLSTIETFVGISVVHLSKSFVPASPTTMYGGVVSVAYYPSSWFGVVSEYSGVTRGPATAQTLLFGPRIAYNRDGRFSPFAQGLVGFVWSNDHLNGKTGASGDETNQENAAASIGGGLDVKVSRHIAVRLANVEYILLRQPAAGFVDTYSRNGFRYSAGITFRFFGPKSARD
jgi:hypothetical protein